MLDFQLDCDLNFLANQNGLCKYKLLHAKELGQAPLVELIRSLLISTTLIISTLTLRISWLRNYGGQSCICFH